MGPPCKHQAPGLTPLSRVREPRDVPAAFSSGATPMYASAARAGIALWRETHLRNYVLCVSILFAYV